MKKKKDKRVTSKAAETAMKNPELRPLSLESVTIPKTVVQIPAVMVPSESEELEVGPIPEEIVALHKTKGPVGISLDEHFGQQSWRNIKAVQRRLVGEGKEFTPDIYKKMFGFTQLPSNLSEEDTEALKKQLKAIRVEEGGFIIVSCYRRLELHVKGFGESKKQLPNEIAPPWMTAVDWKTGTFIYINERGERLENPEDGFLKRYGCYLPLVTAEKDGKGKLVGFKADLRVACPFHWDDASAAFRKPHLPAEEALRYTANEYGRKMENLNLKKMVEEDDMAAMGKEHYAFLNRQKGGDQMKLAFNPKGNRRPQSR